MAWRVSNISYSCNSGISIGVFRALKSGVAW